MCESVTQEVRFLSAMTKMLRPASFAESLLRSGDREAVEGLMAFQVFKSGTFSRLSLEKLSPFIRFPDQSFHVYSHINLFSTALLYKNDVIPRSNVFSGIKNRSHIPGRLPCKCVH